MLQMFRMDIAKVDRDVAYVASVSEACCKCFRDMLQAFVQNVSSILDVRCKHFLSGCFTCFTHMLQEYVRNVSHICCKSMFKMFQLFQSYDAISVYMLQVANILF